MAAFAREVKERRLEGGGSVIGVVMIEGSFMSRSYLNIHSCINVDGCAYVSVYVRASACVCMSVCLQSAYHHYY